jgi:hypothetical protein
VVRTRFGRSGLFDVTVTCQRDSASTPGTDSIVFCSRCGRRNPRPRRSPPAGWRGKLSRFRSRSARAARC